MRYKLLFLNEKNKPETSILVNIERITVTDTFVAFKDCEDEPVFILPGSRLIYIEAEDEDATKLLDRSS